MEYSSLPKLVNFVSIIAALPIYHQAQIEFGKHINPNLRPIAKVSITVTYYETFIPFPPPLPAQ